ncbi:hypothetical protein LguiB_009377 [Lonicera macranthoides]
MGTTTKICGSLEAFNSADSTLGRHLARRLVQIGISDVFSVPGDFNLILLDRGGGSKGPGGAMALPGLLKKSLRVYGVLCEKEKMRGECAVVNNLEDAHELIDTAISTSLKESKPVYISVSCNLLDIPHPAFSREPVPFSFSPKLSNEMGLEAAVEATAEFLNMAVKPVMVTAQDVSTMLRSGQKSVIFLINNGGYTIEVVIHDGPYNVIKNWNYTGLVDAIHNGEGKCWTTKVYCEEELIEAIDIANGEKEDWLCFIEVIVHKDDTSKELLQWGSRVSAANSRLPKPQ